MDRLHKLLRFAALLHDIGHSPFSHAGEDVFPEKKGTYKRYVHEEYSAAIVRYQLRDVIENHESNRNYKINADEVADFLDGSSTTFDVVLWRDLISSQMDGDRMDYLLRDSYHAGVNYGKYDLNRLIATVRIIERPGDSGGGYSIGIDEDGIHAAEGLILARYMMFTQLYFHKTRVIYDYHLIEAIRSVLSNHGGSFPSPDNHENVDLYLEWDDWRVLGAIAAGEGKEHGNFLINRTHYRKLRETKEVPGLEDLEWIEALFQKLEPLGAIRRDADKSWYKFQKLNEEVLVDKESGRRLEGVSVVPLSEMSPVIKGLQSVMQSRIYVPYERRDEAEIIAGKFDRKGDIL